MKPDDLTLMAFADGELTGDEHDAVAEAIERDPSLQKRLEMFQITRQVANDTMHAVPLPSGMEGRIRTAAARIEAEAAGPRNVVALDLKRRIWVRAGFGLAASLALGMMIGAGLMGPVDEDPAGFARLDISPVQPLLGTLPSGDSAMLNGGGRVTMIGSFRTGEGKLCRELEFVPEDGRDIAAVSCFEDGGWRLRFAVAADVPDGETFAAASTLEVLESYVRSIAASPILEPMEEAEALATLR